MKCNATKCRNKGKHKIIVEKEVWGYQCFHHAQKFAEFLHERPGIFER